MRIPPPYSIRVVRERSKAYKAQTSCVEGIHPRWIGALSDQAITVLTQLWRIFAYVGDQAVSQRFVLTRLIEKPTGGWRPIALFRSCFRLWAAVDSGEVRDWAVNFTRIRPWLNTAKNREIGDATWRLQVRREVADADEMAAEVAMDLRKAFDYVDRAEVLWCARAMGYPVRQPKLVPLATKVRPR